MYIHSIKFRIFKPVILAFALLHLAGCGKISNFFSDTIIPDSHNYNIELNDGPNRYIYNSGADGALRPDASKTKEGFVIKAGRNIDRKNYPVHIRVDIGDEDLPRHMEAYQAKIQFSKPGVTGSSFLSGRTTFTRISNEEIVGYFTVSGRNFNAGFTVELIKNEE